MEKDDLISWLISLDAAIREAEKRQPKRLFWLSRYLLGKSTRNTESVYLTRLRQQREVLAHKIQAQVSV